MLDARWIFQKFGQQSDGCPQNVDKCCAEHWPGRQAGMTVLQHFSNTNNKTPVVGTNKVILLALCLILFWVFNTFRKDFMQFLQTAHKLSIWSFSCHCFLCYQVLELQNPGYKTDYIETYNPAKFSSIPTKIRMKYTFWRSKWSEKKDFLLVCCPVQYFTLNN